MPAENIIATHETVENSGSSSSRPSGMLPYLPSGEPEDEDDEGAGGEDEQPAGFSIVQVSAVPEALASEAVLRNPQTQEARSRSRR